MEAVINYGALGVALGTLGLVAKIVLSKPRNGNGAQRVLDTAAAKEAGQMLTLLQEMNGQLKTMNATLATRTFCPYDSRRAPGDMP